MLLKFKSPSKAAELIIVELDVFVLVGSNGLLCDELLINGTREDVLS